MYSGYMKHPDPDFVFLGNNAAVDFVNTKIVRRGERLDLLQDNADLIRWAQEAGRSIDRKLTTGDLSSAKTLRSALQDLFQTSMEQRSAAPGSLTTVNQYLAKHVVQEVLQVNPDNGDLELVPAETASSVSSLLADIAYEGAVLLASPQASQLKHCNNPECVLIFLDTSRNQQRRWCSMDTCGNRAKVAKHYRKQAR